MRWYTDWWLCVVVCSCRLQCAPLCSPLTTESLKLWWRRPLRWLKVHFDCLKRPPFWYIWNTKWLNKRKFFFGVSILDHEIAKRLTFDTSSCPCGGAYQGQPLPQALRFSQGRGERLVMNHKGPWEGYRRQAKPRLACWLLPAFLCVHMFMERETSGCEAASRMFNRKIWRMRHP